MSGVGSGPFSSASGLPESCRTVARMGGAPSRGRGLIREGFKSLIDSEPDLAVVAVTPNGEAGVRLVTELRPDVVVMDIRMPVMDGLAATRRIRSHPGTARRARPDPDDLRSGRVRVRGPSRSPSRAVCPRTPRRSCIRWRKSLNSSPAPTRASGPRRSASPFKASWMKPGLRRLALRPRPARIPCAASRWRPDPHRAPENHRLGRWANRHTIWQSRACPRSATDAVHCRVERPRE